MLGSLVPLMDGQSCKAGHKNEKARISECWMSEE